MTHRFLTALASLVVLAVASSTVLAHCQIPCGIYGDPMRFDQMEEHVTTIEKSMKQIEELSQAADKNYNQIVRWVMNKEDHASQLTEIVTYYFMAQRIKPTDPSDRAAFMKYVKELRLLHEMVVHAMKAKQTTDLEHCEQLRSLIKEFKASYLGEQQAHGHSHGEKEHGHSH